MIITSGRCPSMQRVVQVVILFEMLAAEAIEAVDQPPQRAARRRVRNTARHVSAPAADGARRRPGQGMGIDPACVSS